MLIKDTRSLHQYTSCAAACTAAASDVNVHAMHYCVHESRTQPVMATAANRSSSNERTSYPGDTSIGTGKECQLDRDIRTWQMRQASELARLLYALLCLVGKIQLRLVVLYVLRRMADHHPPSIQRIYTFEHLWRT